MTKSERSPGRPPGPSIVAHRGASREAPENTGAALDAALRHGVAGVECDVQQSADGVPVLYHDRTLAKIGAGRRRVADLRLRELRALDFGAWFDPSFSGEPLMTLDAVLRRYSRRTNLFLEIKSRPRDRAAGRHLLLTEKVLAAADRLVPPERRSALTLLSFDREVLETAAAIAPGLKYVFNIDSPRSFARRLRPRGVPLRACCLPVAKITPAFARRVRSEGLGVMTYSCNVPRQALQALRAGVDVIFTDDPGWLGGYLTRGLASR